MKKKHFQDIDVVLILCVWEGWGAEREGDAGMEKGYIITKTQSSVSETCH